MKLRAVYTLTVTESVDVPPIVPLVARGVVNGDI